MGILDTILGGDDPVKRTASPEEQELLRRSSELLSSPERDRLTGLHGLSIRAAAGGRARRRSAAIGAATGDVQQAFSGPPRTASGALDRALTRARGLSRIARSTSDKFDNMQLRERLGIVKEGRNRQGIGLAALSDIVQHREGLSSSQNALDATRRSSRANIFGTAAGLGIASIPDIRGVLQNRRGAEIGGLGAGGGAPPPRVNSANRANV